jgi:imidazolonepropionase-like amidohydrolase
MIRAAACAVLATALLTPGAWAQNERPAREVFALTNARIVVAPGRVIERGTVVIRDGRIQAVGAGVRAPADAFPMDLQGLTVYPGLIDAASSFALPRVGAPAGGGPGGGGAAAAASGEAGGEIQPAREAAAAFAARAADLEALRAAGITTVGLAFDGGIFPGRAAVVSAGTGPAASLVLRSPAAQQVAFGTARGVYPSTLMGSLAYIRQSFLDADHARRTAAAWARDPAAVRRPEQTPDAQALGAAGARELPVWIAASRENDLRRAIDLGRELGLDYRLLGAQEGYRMAADLARLGQPVMVSLDFPRPAQVTGRAFELRVAPASGPDAGTEQADSAVMREVRGNAAALVRAGVPVALVSHGLARPAEFRDRIRDAVAAGLSADEALRALTVTPARVLGMERALGTIEAGKLANLVVVQGDLFARDAQIRHVFVEGRHFEQRPTTRARPDAATPPTGPLRPDVQRPPEAVAIAAVARVEGTWTAEASAQGQVFAFTLTLRQEGTRLSGELASAAGASTLVGEITGDRMVLRGQVLVSPDLPPTNVTISAVVDGDRMSGTAETGGFGVADFQATRASGGNR